MIITSATVPQSIKKSYFQKIASKKFRPSISWIFQRVPYVFLVVTTWFSVCVSFCLPYVFLMFSLCYPVVFLMLSFSLPYVFPMFSLWFPHGFLCVFLKFSVCFPFVFLMCSFCFSVFSFCFPYVVPSVFLVFSQRVLFLRFPCVFQYVF